MEDEKLLKKTLLRPDEVAGILRISKRKVYYLAGIGVLKAARFGRPVRILSSSVRAMLVDPDDA